MFLPFLPCRHQPHSGKGAIPCFKRFFLNSLLIVLTSEIKNILHDGDTVIIITHTTNLQQTTLKTSVQKNEHSPFMTVYLLNRVENIVANGEIVHHEQFNLFKCRTLHRRQKASTCGKGLKRHKRKCQPCAS